ncbi:MAG: F0F1 ATP synthase subunit alpha [Rickettsiales bacterium]|jgi:F-type H+-transporting ATPase subunit alpha|nr:F0F1 ATP synthase subunit alpha [Rickettsiales bacterium]
MELEDEILTRIEGPLRSSIASFQGNYISFDEAAVVTKVSGSVVVARGFTKISQEECVSIDGKYLGIVSIIDGSVIKIIMLDKTDSIKVGSRVRRTSRPLMIPVGDGLVGRVVDGLCRPIDGKESIPRAKSLPVERPATSIIDRKSVERPLQTGIKAIDSLIPIGRGQRELILGDRQTGKTTLALDTILSQKDQDVLCIYCSIGQRDSSLASTFKLLKSHGAMAYTIIVHASGSEIAGHQFVAPYAATSIAEYFMEQGRHVLLVYDDLTKHARIYREISLLLEKNPGREAFPADIFYAHARLLERSTNRTMEAGGGSITSLPIVETESENISAYVPTNIISITDGQIYLSPLLFHSGILPAIDVGKSVSRVGSAAQLPAYRSAVRTLGIDYSQFEELESFSKFSINLDEATEKVINRGKQIREVLKQKIHSPLDAAKQVGILLCLNNNVFSKVPPEKMDEAQDIALGVLDESPGEMVDAINGGRNLDQNVLNSFLSRVKNKLGGE